MLGDRDRPVAAAGAPDRYDEVRLALLHILVEQEVEQPLQSLVDLLQAAVAPHVVDHALVVPGQLAQLGLAVRVRQEADVESEIPLARGAVLEPEAPGADRSPAG